MMPGRSRRMKFLRREPGEKHTRLRQTQSPRTGSEHPIRGSYQRKGPAIGKAIRFKNIQRHTRYRRVNLSTKESIFRHRGPCHLQRRSPSDSRTRFFHSDGNRPQECAIVQLQFAGIYRASEERAPRAGSSVVDSRMSEALNTRVRAAGGDG